MNRHPGHSFRSAFRVMDSPVWLTLDVYSMPQIVKRVYGSRLDCAACSGCADARWIDPSTSRLFVEGESSSDERRRAMSDLALLGGQSN